MGMVSLAPWWVEQIEQSGWISSPHQVCLVLHNSQAQDVASYLAQQSLCQEASSTPCGSCSSCHAFSRGEHPDLTLIQPITTKTIGVQLIRDALSSIGHSPTLAQKRVIWIHSLDAMTEAANNAILKTLEEPPSNCVFILSARSAMNIMPTIKSRVFMLSMRYPQRADLEDYWRQYHDSSLQDQLDGHTDLLLQAIDKPDIATDYLHVKQVISEVAMGKRFAVGSAEQLLKRAIHPIWVIQLWLRDTYRVLTQLPSVIHWPHFYHGSVSVNTQSLLQLEDQLQSYLYLSENAASFNHALVLDQLLLTLRQLTRELTQ